MFRFERLYFCRSNFTDTQAPSQVFKCNANASRYLPPMAVDQHMSIIPSHPINQITPDPGGCPDADKPILPAHRIILAFLLGISFPPYFVNINSWHREAPQ